MLHSSPTSFSFSHKYSINTTYNRTSLWIPPSSSPLHAIPSSKSRTAMICSGGLQCCTIPLRTVAEQGSHFHRGENLDLSCLSSAIANVPADSGWCVSDLRTGTVAFTTSVRLGLHSGYRYHNLLLLAITSLRSRSIGF